MCKEEEDIHVAAKYLKIEISYLLLGTWTSANHTSDLIQEEKKSLRNHKIRQDDRKVHINL